MLINQEYFIFLNSIKLLCCPQWNWFRLNYLKDLLAQKLNSLFLILECHKLDWIKSYKNNLFLSIILNHYQLLPIQNHFQHFGYFLISNNRLYQNFSIKIDNTSHYQWILFLCKICHLYFYDGCFSFFHISFLNMNLKIYRLYKL